MLYLRPTESGTLGYPEHQNSACNTVSLSKLLLSQTIRWEHPYFPTKKSRKLSACVLIVILLFPMKEMCLIPSKASISVCRLDLIPYWLLKSFALLHYPSISPCQTILFSTQSDSTPFQNSRLFLSHIPFQLLSHFFLVLHCHTSLLPTHQSNLIFTSTIQWFLTKSLISFYHLY